MSAQADWVLRKRGYFYRPNASGYTSSIHEAGRYTEAEAKDHAARGIHPPVTAHPASEFVQVDDMRAALEQIITVCADNAPASCNHQLALDFVRQVANAAIGNGALQP